MIFRLGVIMLLFSIAFRSARTNCLDRNGLPMRCIPPFENAAEREEVDATNTCGSPPSLYCSLTDTEAECVTCDASSPTLSHNAVYLTDENDNDNPTWWQSNTFMTYPQELKSNLTISLGKTYDVTFVKLKFYSPQPRSFAIYRSSDFGRTFEPWHFYSESCSYFNLPQNDGRTPFGDSEAVCTTKYTNMVPLSGGEVTFATLENRRSKNTFDSSSELQNWVTATDVRVVLSQPNTFGDEIYNNTRTLRSYFYAVQDLSIGARCKCHGHASRCSEDLVAGLINCDCEHQTTGRDCESCLPFYQDHPWRRASEGGANECVRCECNGHADECVFDQARFDATGSGGVCQACRDRTEGQHCDRCISGYYLRKDRSIADADACDECRCTAAGVTGSGCDPGTGQCPCKRRVEGRKCNRCKSRFWNLQSSNGDGCQNCRCYSPGTINGDRDCDKETGQCGCKDNVIERTCNTCTDEFYGLDGSNPVGCTPCGCYLAGSQSNTCNKLTGACECWPNVHARDCYEPDDGFFFPNLDILKYEAEDGSGTFTFDTSVDEYEVNFTGRGVAIISQGDIIVFPTVIAPKSGRYNIYIRYTLEGFVTWSSVEVRVIPGREDGSGPPSTCIEGSSVLNQTVVDISPGVAVSRKLEDAVCLRGGRSYTIRLRAGQPTSDNSLRRLLANRKLAIDSIVLIPIPEEFGRFEDDVLGTLKECERMRSALGSQTGDFSNCNAFEAQVTTALNDGVAGCACNSTGSDDNVCAKVGGQCSCKPGIGGRQCDYCRPGFYNFSSEGCKPCSCNMLGSKNGVCDLQTGQCMCHPGVADTSMAPGETGRRCTQCLPRLFGFDSGEGCEECKCNPLGSTSAVCSTDGRCNCKAYATGARCDQCVQPHHQLTATDCVPCNCDQDGSETLDCDSSGKCTCKKNTKGKKCVNCEDFAFNKNGENPYGCQSCFCFGHSTDCGPARGLVKSEIISDFSADVEGWRAVDGDGNDFPFDYRKGKQAVRVSSDGTGDVFFELPAKFLGDIRMSYGMKMSFQIRFTTPKPLSQIQSGQDVIIQSGSTSVFADLDGSPTADMQTFEIPMDESAFKLLRATAVQLEMIEVLSSVDSIRIRASYLPGHQSTILLYGLKLETAVEGSNGTAVESVEQCVCPVGHTGMSCESCMPGYKHERPLLGSQSKCVPCECNNHSNTCDQTTGACSGCQDNTQGDRCDQCAAGFYGDPSQGTADDCHPCPCPDANGPLQFGSACEMTPSGDIVCTNCSRGHTGPRCDVCMDGYFGDPRGQNGNASGCSDCSCNGNIDMSATGNCNRETGKCLKCIGNTAGRYCQKCKPGYFGDAVTAKDCSPCDCVDEGTLPGDQCDDITGVCNCKPNVEGNDCGSCVANHSGLESGEGCTACNCHPLGSASLQCDRSGQCTCQPGVGGQKCDICRDEFYGLTTTGCKKCGCDPRGSRDLLCNNITGICQCKDGVEGDKCDQCSLGTQDLDRGCVECSECFRQVKGVHNTLLALMKKLDTLLQRIPLGGTVSTDDFDKALQQTRHDISQLLNATKDARLLDDDLLRRLDVLDDLIARLKGQVSRMNSTLYGGENHGRNAVLTVTNSESVVAEIKVLIDNIVKRIENRARAALDEAKKASATGANQNKELQDILRDATTKANDQDDQASEIEMNADEAVAIAKDANKLAKEAVTLQEQAIDAARKLVANIANASKLADEADKAIDNATAGSTDVLVKSQEILARAKMPLSDIDSDGLLQRATDALGNASQLVLSADTLLQDNEALMKFVQESRDEVDLLLDEGKKSQKKAAELLARVNAAVHLVDDSIVDFARSSRAVEELKDDLEDITNILDKYKIELERALDAIKLVASKTDKTNKLSANSRAILEAAEKNATAARDIGKQARDLAAGVLKDAEEQEIKARDALEGAESALRLFKTLEKDANDTRVRLESLSKAVSMQTDRIETARQTAEESESLADGAGKEAEMLRAKLAEMEMRLRVNGSLDLETLLWIEQQLQDINTALADFNVDKVVAAFEDRDAEQRRKIAVYEDRLTAMNTDLTRVMNINASIPAPPECFNSRVVPGDG